VSGVAEGGDGPALFHEAGGNCIFLIPGVIYTSTDCYTNCIHSSCGLPRNERWGEGINKLGGLIKRLN
jgi:DNA-binding transcriptional MocR family regulator